MMAILDSGVNNELLSTKSNPKVTVAVVANPNSDQLHDSPAKENGHAAPIAVPGPVVDGRETTATLYSIESMAASDLVPGMVDLLNRSFSDAHEKHSIFPVAAKRVADRSEFILQLGKHPETFIYVLAFADDPQNPIATVNARRWMGCNTLMTARADGTTFRNEFTRLGVVPDGAVAWMVHQMATDPKLQRRGLAIHLVKSMEQEILRRFVADRKAGLHDADQLWIYLDTIKESNNGFHEGRGYVVDGDRSVSAGYFGALRPFTVQFLSKQIATGI